MMKPTESQIQAAFVEYVKVKHPLLGRSIIKITNEGKRSERQGKKMKDEGLLPGAADFFFSRASLFKNYRGTVWHGFWCEVKAPGRKPTKLQLQFLAEQTENNYFAFWSDDLDDIIDKFEIYIEGMEYEQGTDRASIKCSLKES